jgi:hypothetical protein
VRSDARSLQSCQSLPPAFFFSDEDDISLSFKSSHLICSWRATEALIGLCVRRDYSAAIDQYRRRTWTCARTGATGLTYEEALSSELFIEPKVRAACSDDAWAWHDACSARPSAALPSSFPCSCPVSEPTVILSAAPPQHNLPVDEHAKATSLHKHYNEGGLGISFIAVPRIGMDEVDRDNVLPDTNGMSAYSVWVQMSKAYHHTCEVHACAHICAPSVGNLCWPYLCLPTHAQSCAHKITVLHA